MIFFGLSVFLLPVIVAAATFQDLPAEHFAHEAVSALSQEGIVTGYGDGTFRPEQSVSRAEALALIQRLSLQENYIASFRSTPFTDIAEDAWYLPHVEIARQQSVVDGPPEVRSFFPDRQVNLAEFLKMLLLSERLASLQYAGEGKPLAADALDPSAWFVPYLSYGVALGMIYPDADGNISPGRLLSRAEAAVFLYRYLQYKKGSAVERQRAMVQEEIHTMFTALRDGDSERAKEASYRAILLADGLVRRRPDSSLFAALQQITWAAGKLIKGEEQEMRTLLEQARTLSADLSAEYEGLFAEWKE